MSQGREQDQDQVGAAADEHALDAHTFGQLLRELRLTYGERVLRSGEPSTPHVTLHATALIDSMRELGYSISPATYSGIETGASLPHDIPRFLDTISPCLRLSPVERRRLLEQIAFDILRTKLGSDLAMRVVHRWRDQARLPLASSGGDVER